MCRTRFSTCSRRIRLFSAVLAGVTLSIVAAHRSGALAAEPLPSRQDQLSLPGLIPEPAMLPGVGRWQLVRKFPLGVLPAAAWSPDGTRLALADHQFVRMSD